MSTTSFPKRILLIGNSPNLLMDDRSWKNLIEQLWATSRDYTGSEDADMVDAPFVFQMQALTNIHDAVREEGDAEGKLQKAWEKWYSGVARIKPGPIHDLIAKYDHLFDQYLTTNYDYALEKALHHEVKSTEVDRSKKNACRHHGKVWHIHGEALHPDSIVISLNRYMEALKELQDIGDGEESGTWLEHFLTAEVYICGLNLSYEEYLIWYALQKRFKLGKKRRMPVHIYQWLCPPKAVIFIDFSVRTG